MVYHRASAKQLQYLSQLAKLTTTELPWGWEGYSVAEAAKQITRLRRKHDKQVAAKEAGKQSKLF